MTDELLSERLPFTRALNLLSDRDRRRILVALHSRDRGDRLRVPDDLTIGDEDPERAMLRMHHVHLPRLVDAGVIEYDRDAWTVARGPRFAEIAALLDVLAENDDALPWDVT